MKLVESPSKISEFVALADQILKIATSARNSFVLMKNGDLFVFGDNSEGQSTGFGTRYNEPTHIPIDTDIKEKVVDIYTGYNHVAVIGEKGNIYTWGSTSQGKLGYADMKQYTNTPKVLTNLKGRNANYIYLGKHFTIISTGEKK